MAVGITAELWTNQESRISLLVSKAVLMNESPMSSSELVVGGPDRILPQDSCSNIEVLSNSMASVVMAQQLPRGPLFPEDSASGGPGRGKHTSSQLRFTYFYDLTFGVPEQRKGAGKDGHCPQHLTALRPSARLHKFRMLL